MNTILISASLVVFATVVGIYYMYQDRNHSRGQFSD